MQPTKSLWITLGLVFVLAGSSACSATLGEGRRQLHKGRYAEALEQLVAAEAQFPAGSPAEAEYALYRGLTELCVGNAASAHHWLERARTLSRRDPARLTRSERGRLRAAWAALGLLPGQAAPASP